MARDSRQIREVTKLVPSFSWEKFKKKGGHHMSKRSMRTLQRKNAYFFALKMANNTLIFLSLRGVAPLGSFSQVSPLFNFEDYRIILRGLGVGPSSATDCWP